jgi:selenocysteine-specific elongation factor
MLTNDPEQTNRNSCDWNEHLGHKSVGARIITTLLVIQMKSVIVGTAGHIDHGKTALVRALTGIDADRLPEEKRRGITIDIGFADLDLGDVRAGFVDVPGHEKFVKNMLAGAHGIDLVTLVIAADESVMPQTREHFEICRLLGVQHGLVVLTKKDLVDEEMLALVREEAKALVTGSFLDAAPVISVSSRTGEGLDKLKTALHEIALQVPARSEEFIMRLPIDRAFTMSGFGAVVTGTLIAGAIEESDELELLPAARPVRVRGLQVHGKKVKRANAGQRTAVNVAGIEPSELERGMLLAPPQHLQPTQIMDARVMVLANAPRSLKSRQRVRVHVAAAEILARVRVLEESGEIKPGDRGFIQLRLEAPIVGVLGDRFILRSYSPQYTIAGGVIIDPFSPKHRARELAHVRERLNALLEGSREEKVGALVENAPNGLNSADIVARTGWRDHIVITAIKSAHKQGLIAETGGQLFGTETLAGLKHNIVKDIRAHHEAEPLSRGLGLEILRGRYFAQASPDLFRAVLADLQNAGALVIEKDIVRSPEHARAVSGEDAALRDRLEAVYRDAKLAAPSISEALSRAGIGASQQQHGRKVMQVLIDSGKLVGVDGEMFFHASALEELMQKLRSFAATKSDRSIDVPTFKGLAGISRKYAIPLLEYLDRQRVTRREGDKRIVMSSE